MGKAVELGVKIATTTDTAPLDRYASAVKSMSDAIDRAADKAANAGDRLDRVSEAADGLDLSLIHI